VSNNEYRQLEEMKEGRKGVKRRRKKVKLTTE